MSQSQTGKVVVITGGNSGMGFATAKLFIQEGAEVFITGRDAQTLKVALQELGPKARGMISDSSKLSDIAELAATLKETYGRIDTLFVNAGIGKFSPFAETTEAIFDSVFNTNVKGPYFFVQKVLPLLSSGSSVILNASVVANTSMPNASVYSMSKAAVKSMVQNLTTELTPKGIRVNSISPGPIDTPIFGKADLSPEQIVGFKAQMAAQVPLGRLGTPDEIAKAVLFLGSSAASFVSGAELVVDGGMIRL